MPAGKKIRLVSSTSSEKREEFFVKEEFIFAPPVSGNLPFQLYLGGISYCDGNYRIVRENVPYYTLEAVISGKGEVKVGSEIYYPQRGDCYLLPPHQEVCYESDPREPWTKFWYNFSEPLFPELLRHLKIGGIWHFPKVFMQEQFSACHQKLSDTSFNLRQIVFSGILVSLISEIAAKHHDMLGDNLFSYEGNLLLRVLDEYITSPSPPLSVLAAKINTSESQMLRIFRRDFGCSPIFFLHRKKMELACHLLQDTRLQVKEIAWRLGFHDEFYFSKLFRKKIGKSPKQFRLDIFPARKEDERERKCPKRV